MRVRYAIGKGEKVGKSLEMDIDDAQDKYGIEYIELRWTKFDTITTHQVVKGLQAVSIMRGRNGSVAAAKLVFDSAVEFRPDERGRGFAYVPKTEKNIIKIAGLFAANYVRPTDDGILKEIKEIIASDDNTIKMKNKRDTAIDAALNVRTQKTVLRRNEKLKEELAVIEAEEENARLEEKIAALRKAKVDAEKTEEVEEVTPEPVDDAKVDAEKEKRTINTKNMKHK